MSTDKIWISLEGNIGSGKSTLLANVLPHLPADMVKIDEPVALWQSTGMLEKSYTNPACYGFPAQVHFFTSRIQEQTLAVQNHPSASIFLSERSPASDKLFWQTQLYLDLIPQDLGSIYTDIWSLWQKCVAPFRQPTCFVYLDTPAGTCHDRMESRKRPEETGVSLAYLQTLEDMHREQFDHPSGALMPDGTRVPVLKIDGLRDFRNPSVAKEIAAEILVNL
jgi:deoxyadenosine/deoxycytidine kinase